MTIETGDRKSVYIAALSIAFLAKNSEWNIIFAIILCCFIVYRSGRLDFDLGDLMIFFLPYSYHSMFGHGTKAGFFTGIGFLALYQIGKRMYDGDGKDFSALPITVPAFLLALKGVLDYSYVIRESASSVETTWPDWSGVLKFRNLHEYYLIPIAVLLVYFIYYAIKINLVGIIGAAISIAVVVLAIYASGRLAFFACILTFLAITVGIAIENRLYEKKLFMITGAVILGLSVILFVLYLFNAFGLYDTYKYSMWSADGGVIHNERFNIMKEQLELILENPLSDCYTPLTNYDGTEIHFTYNSWLQAGRLGGIVPMFLMAGFTVLNMISAVTVWTKSRSVGRYAVLAAFAGLTFINMVDSVLAGNQIFWCLEIYLGGLLRAMYNRVSKAKRLKAEVTAGVCI